MKRNPIEKIDQAIRDSLLSNHPAREMSDKKTFAGEVIAALYRCQKCNVWWGASENDRPETRLVWQFVEPHSTEYLWMDYRGWQRTNAVERCPSCAHKTAAPDIVLRFDDDGEVIWPDVRILDEDISRTEPGTDSNPFLVYVSQSQYMEENITAITAREAQRESNSQGYTADIDDIRDEMNRIRIAFKDVVYSYAPILPPGWRVIADFDKWVAGKACAGFLHGEVQPDISLLIGGDCTTVAEIEMKLDRLVHYVHDL